MTDRRTVLADAAIEVVGRAGLRGLTHRAVDAEAGLPIGSTSNVYPTRDALLGGVVDRFVDREREAWDEVAARLAPTSPGVLAAALGEWARAACGPQRAVTSTRYALLVEAAHRPSLRSDLALGGARAELWFRTWLRTVGSPDVDGHLHLVANYVTGAILHQLAIPDPDFDPTPRIEALLLTLLQPVSS